MGKERRGRMKISGDENLKVEKGGNVYTIRCVHRRVLEKVQVQVCIGAGGKGRVEGGWCHQQKYLACPYLLCQSMFM